MFINIVFTLSFAAQLSVASIYDCWNQEKLQRMKLGASDNPADPGLSQFSKMVRCLSMQQGMGSKSTLDDEWQQWANVAGGQFMPAWKDPKNPGNIVGEDPWSRRQPTGSDFNNYNTNNNNYRPPPPSQKQPGVHPDDWSQRGQNIGSDRPNYGKDFINGRPRDRDRNRERDPFRDLDSYRERDPYRERDRFKERKNNRRLNDPVDLGLPTNTQERYDQATWNNPNPLDYPNTITDPEEVQNLSLSRKYVYAIMALSVIVLAVLMVAAMFCCGTSNSTMSQSAAETLPNNQFDAYSVYSYKGPGVGADTLRSMGTLGGMSMHTDTLRSMHSRRGSPQYRISDIDPDYSRKLNEQIHC